MPLCLYAPPEAATDAPVLVLDYPDAVKDRQLVRIDASKSDADDIQFDFDDAPADSFHVEGRVAFWAASPGKWRVVVRAAKCIDGKAKQERGTVTLDVAGGPVTPTVPTTLAKVAYDNAVIYVDAADRAEAAQALAVAYRLVAGKSGKVKTPQDFVKLANLTTDMILKQLGGQAKWKNWFATMDKALELRGIDTIPELKTAYEQIAEGLESVK